MAFISHQRASDAIRNEKFKQEIVPIEVKTKRETKIIDTDEHPNPKTSIETLAKLRSALKKDGTVTAGNASSINDGGRLSSLWRRKRRLNWD